MSRAGRKIAISLLLLGVVAIVATAATYVVQTDYFGKKVKIAMVVKSSGSGFFEAAHLPPRPPRGLATSNWLSRGRTAVTAQGQIEIIDSLLNHGLFEKKVDAIVVSANDRDALVPVAQKAMASGVKVLSFDSGIAKEGRVFHLLPSSTELDRRETGQDDGRGDRQRGPGPFSRRPHRRPIRMPGSRRRRRSSSAPSIRA